MDMTLYGTVRKVVALKSWLTRGVEMSDWSTADVSYEVDPVNELQKPPMAFLIATAVSTVCSLGLILFNSTAGYGLTVLASLLGGYTALVDQKRRGSSNYISYESFKNILRLTRYSIVGIAIAHIVVLAIDAANGGGLF
jgi:hypothetical protein